LPAAAWPAAVVAAAGPAAPAAPGALPAPADDAARIRAAEAMETMHALLGQALAAYRDGERKRAYDLVRLAYLDHFEYLEIPLRLADPGFTLDMELRFATLWNQIDAGAPLPQVEQTALGVKEGLARANAVLEEAGLGVPAVAFATAFAIVVREGLEAALLVAALVTALATMRQRAYARYIYRGAGLALLATGATWAVARWIVTINPARRELIEAVTSLLAVVVLFLVSFWLLQRLEHRRWMEYVRGRVWEAMQTGRPLALVGVGFTAVYREGFETVLFYTALGTMAEQARSWVLWGFLAGSLALGALVLAMVRFGARLPTRQLLGAAMVVTALLSVALLGNGVRQLQEAGLFPLTPLGWVPPVSFTLMELTGIHSTVETLAAQAALLVVYAVGGLLVLRPRGAPRAWPPAGVAPEG
ncbi:MAG TPA: FTR1 family protein, partial [Thermodesulfobacteriota bacterium]|nr:FTR1 family protein [Thermodesulfobacteriota bacterium]